MTTKSNFSTQATVALASLFVASTSVHAASATATVAITMNVNAPKCSVAATTGSTVSLPMALSPTTTVGSYLSTNFTTASHYTSVGWVTSSNVNQTATISCDTPNTIITSFLVQPGSGASLYPGTTGYQYLVDGSSPPVQAAGGGIVMAYEQVSVNGIAAPFAYLTGNSSYAYSTPFSTDSSTPSTATVVWRPIFYPQIPEAKLGNPTGGAYTAPATIVANY
ncbi:hypothetical protein ACT2FY_01095 [Paraburkholderia fungorum]|uniref:hypothetical protein n=1 Tax=Paraburkholderia fungorum TaxID=134537 RepID=UPI00402BDB29